MDGEGAEAPAHISTSVPDVGRVRIEGPAESGLGTSSAATPSPVAAALDAQAAREMKVAPAAADESRRTMESDEQSGAKVKRRPGQPTPAEIDEHEASGHLPYRSWCRNCVAGRGRSDLHRSEKVAPLDDFHPVIGMDYGWMNALATPIGQKTTANEKTTPILCIRCLDDGWTDSVPLPSKGTVYPYNAKVVTETLADSGFSDMQVVALLKSDQEPSLMELKREVMRQLRDRHGIRVAPNESPVGDSSSNGLAESAVRDVKDLARTIRSSVEEMHGCIIKPTHPIMTWICRYPGFMINRFARGKDGRTPYERRRGKRYKKAMTPFGEKVMYLPAGKRSTTGHADKWQEGIFLGIQSRSDEVVIGTSAGIVKARSHRRLDLSRRSDATMLLSIRGTPWQPVPGGPEGREITVSTHLDPIPVVPNSELPPTLERSEETAVRKTCIRKEVELVQFGYTPNCG